MRFLRSDTDGWVFRNAVSEEAWFQGRASRSDQERPERLSEAFGSCSCKRADLEEHAQGHRCIAELKSELPKLMTVIHQDGMIWVSWPKKSSGVPSSVTEDTVRDVALPLGLVDVKVCAVDEIWSGLKLVIRKELRK